MCEKCTGVDEMIGRKFGKLTVLERVENSKDNSKQYLCECDCGNKVKKIGRLLKNGKTIECGHCDDPKPGMKYGKLTIISKTDRKNKRGNCLYECQCECGNITIVAETDLKTGHTKTCGHCSDLKPGERFWNLTVVRKTEEKNKKGQYLYECRCDCGNTTKTSKGNLRLGRTKTCGHCSDLKPGERFWNLTVVRKTEEKDRSGCYYYECQCSCGKTTKVISANLKRGCTKSCGHCNDIKPGDRFGSLTVVRKTEEKNNSGHYYYECLCSCGKTTKVIGSNLKQGHVKTCGHCNDLKPGERFGSLTVIRKTEEKNNSGYYYYECQCDCGNITKTIKNHLKLGYTKTCGHCNDLKPGERFGSLTVIKKLIKRNKYRNCIYECQCDCGNITEVVGVYLRSGNTKTCGHCKDIKLGTRFKNLIVIKKAEEKYKNGEYLYECLCDCGNMVKVPSSALRNGNTKSCGCLGSSLGEHDIYKFLDANFISYVRERKIKELVTSKGGHPRFDFEIFDKYGDSFFLEFHGEQHYWPMRKAGFGENQREETDPMKIKYCEDNNITFHTIGFFEDTINSLKIILYFHELLSPEKEKRNRIVYKLKQTLFEDKNGHLSIFSSEEELETAA